MLRWPSAPEMINRTISRHRNLQRDGSLGTSVVCKDRTHLDSLFVERGHPLLMSKQKAPLRRAGLFQAYS